MTFMSMFERWTGDWARVLSVVSGLLERFRHSPAGLQIEPLTQAHSSFHLYLSNVRRFEKVDCRTEALPDGDQEVVF
jgi:hypothetical protein